MSVEEEERAGGRLSHPATTPRRRLHQVTHPTALGQVTQPAALR
jgi:hypothetical protein